MTEHIQINDVSPRIQYLADGVQAAFSFPFAVFKDSDLEVWQDDALRSDGYAVSGAGISTGGVALFANPPAAGSRVTLRRRLVISRTTDYQADGLIRAKTLNDEMDYQTAALQQVAEDVGRAVKRSATSAALADITLPEPVAGRGLKWNAEASALINSANDPDAAGDATSAAAQAVAAAIDATLARDVILAAVDSVGDPLAKAANLADLPDASAARDNLGLGGAARRDVGSAPGNLVELDDNSLIAAAWLPPIETIPPGTVTAFAGATAPPTWLICDGTLVSRATYAALFAVLGTTFGAGDGSTTFALPDLRGRAAIGAGRGTNLTDRTIGGKIGTETHVLSIAEMPSHSHGCAVIQSSETSGYMGGATATSGTSGGSGGGQAHNNMPPSLVLNFIIKA